VGSQVWRTVLSRHAMCQAEETYNLYVTYLKLTAPLAQPQGITPQKHMAPYGSVTVEKVRDGGGSRDLTRR